MTLFVKQQLRQNVHRHLSTHTLASKAFNFGGKTCLKLANSSTLPFRSFNTSEESEPVLTCFRRIRNCIHMRQKNKSLNLPLCFSADKTFIHGATVPSSLNHSGYFLIEQRMSHSVEYNRLWKNYVCHISIRSSAFTAFLLGKTFALQYKHGVLHFFTHSMYPVFKQK
ncbi:hypothetical protein NPIL_92971 [Nephila pilipes]|uniref:Uncharacterized protein n=1 Tax=Nephila pilipes TaxID=299642 RepID=A0A8X6M8L3_NEPPI|nr:hypothetical protein NPIL_92971 [Nephila pilipes]